MSQPLPTIDSLLGTQIRVITVFGEEIDGELYCCDLVNSNTVILCQRLDNGLVNYKWIKANIIREVSANSAVPLAGADEHLPHVDLRHLEARSTKLEEEAQENARRYGVGVTEQAQEVFDALAKTMDAQWDGEDIKVYGVRISKPYDPARSISGGDEQAQERVRKVLVGELARLSERKKRGMK
eukprot:TRINITY_DN47927_c0_g1_i1.p1 TRINITY_DN47927_c0_g1~~TRINITY_DN47927_c0_g1_i1.p1  ORF type:complete len:183 (+),score=29.03 TRINITY_DN47927_c0_g1_i1:88-636(+)